MRIFYVSYGWQCSRTIEGSVMEMEIHNNQGYMHVWKSFRLEVTKDFGVIREDGFIDEMKGNNVT